MTEDLCLSLFLVMLLYLSLLDLASYVGQICRLKQKIIDISTRSVAHDNPS